MTIKKSVIFAFITLLIGSVLYLNALTPSSTGPWTQGQDRVAQINFNGELVEIIGVRDFDYDTKTKRPSVERYTVKSFAPDHLVRTWFGISHFGGMGLAHVFLSFEFLNPAGQRQFLAASVEARLRTDQSYNPVKGVFRRYTKVIVFGTEQDVIGLRAQIRGERVLMYPLDISISDTQKLFAEMARDGDKLETEPEFYNTLLDNCLTNLAKHGPDYSPLDNITDYRLLLPGYSDKVLFEQQLIDTNQPLSEQRLRYRISNEPELIHAEDYSIAIRQAMGMPEYQPLIELE